MESFSVHNENLQLGKELQRLLIDCRDGAAAHFSAVDLEFLIVTYRVHWIGRGGPHIWPTQSSDVSLMNFFYGAI